MNHARATLAAAALASAVAGCGGAAAPMRATTDKTTAPQSAVGPASRRAALLSGAASRRARVPILMFHVIAQAPAGAVYPELFTPPAAFAAQMRALSAAGFHGVTLDEALAAWRGDDRLPHHPVVVSFDDGSAGQATRAGPVLRRLGWPGVLNLELNDLGPDGMPVHLVRRLVRAGWEVDSHTVTHPDLTTVDATRLRAELTVSRSRLQRMFGVRVDAFCYPAGRFDAAAEAAVRRAGYRAATTEVPGAATAGSDRYALPRIRVDGGIAPAVLARELRTITAR